MAPSEIIVRTAPPPITPAITALVPEQPPLTTSPNADLTQASLPKVSAVETTRSVLETLGPSIDLNPPRVAVEIGAPIGSASAPLEKSLDLYTMELQNQAVKLTKPYFPNAALSVVEDHSKSRHPIRFLMNWLRPQNTFDLMVNNEQADVALLRFTVRGRAGDFRVAIQPFESPDESFTNLASKLADEISTTRKRFKDQQALRCERDAQAKITIASSLTEQLEEVETQQVVKAQDRESALKRLATGLDEFQQSASGKVLSSVLARMNRTLVMPTPISVVFETTDEGYSYEKRHSYENRLGYGANGWFIEQRKFARFSRIEGTELEPEGKHDTDLRAIVAQEMLESAVAAGLGMGRVASWIEAEAKKLAQRD